MSLPKMYAGLVNLAARAGRILLMIRYARVDILAYRLHNWLHGVDLKPRTPESLGLSPSLSVSYGDSGPSLTRLLRRLDIRTARSAVDLGSGKGGATFIFSRAGFSEVVGVEISPELVCVAEDNAVRLKVRNVRFVCQDASVFTDLDQFTYVYMYHPFREAIVRKVMANLRASLERVPRALTLIYLNPQCQEIIAQSKIFNRLADYIFKPDSHCFRVYTHNG